ncbi:MAG: peptidoglycan D,D-transpeptidase FtsI family protein [Nostocoides sp.]
MFLVAAFVLSIFAAQTLRIQGLDNDAVAAQALNERQGQGSVIPALRGSITDRNGAVLAASTPVRTVVIDQTAVCTYGFGGQDCDPGTAGVAIQHAAQKLAPLLRLSESTLIPKLTGDRRYVIVAKNVSEENWNRVASLGIPGVYSERGTTRAYPTGTTSASLVGFVRNDGEPGAGLELQLNKALAGQAGSEKSELSQGGMVIPNSREEITPAVPGKDVELTIDADLQWYAQNALASQIKKVNALSGTAVVMDVKTGQLLALASYPTFDPANFGASASNGLSNRAFTDVFEPGSTAKVVTMAAGLQEGAITPSTPVIVPSQLYRQGQMFRDAEAHGTEYLTATGALAKSSNMGMMLISETMKPATIYHYFRTFGFGETSGSGFAGESAGLLTNYTKWNGTQRYTVVYGQGVSVTAVQDASVFQTIANGGVRVPPRLVKAVASDDGSMAEQAQPDGIRVVSPQVADQVSTMLEGVVSDQGTAPAAKIAGYRVAGKTGTANRYDPTLKKYSGYTASFIGYAPADNPRFVVAVIVQRPVKGTAGGVVAAPVFKEVMTYALQHFKVPPTGTKSPTVTVELDGPPAADDPTVIGRASGATGQ